MIQQRERSFLHSLNTLIYGIKLIQPNSKFTYYRFSAKKTFAFDINTEFKTESVVDKVARSWEKKNE